MKAQLNVRLEAPLVLQVQKASKQQGRTLAACVAMALEQWLAAPSSVLQEPLPINRLEELEKRLERLEQQRGDQRSDRTLKPDNQQPRAKAAPAKPSTIVPTGEALTTAALAELLQMRRGTINARIARAGGAAPGLVIDGWSCIGTAVPKRGGPAQALWQQA